MSEKKPKTYAFAHESDHNSILVMSAPFTRMNFTPQAVNDYISEISALRGRSTLTREELLDVLRVFFALNRD